MASFTVREEQAIDISPNDGIVSATLRRIYEPGLHLSAGSVIACGQYLSICQKSITQAMTSLKSTSLLASFIAVTVDWRMHSDCTSVR